MQKDLIHVIRRSRVLGALPTRARGSQAYPEASTGRFTAVSSASPNHLIAATGTVGSPLRAHRSDSALAGLFTSLAWVSSSIVEESAARWARSTASLATRRDMSPTAQDPSPGSCR